MTATNDVPDSIARHIRETAWGLDRMNVGPCTDHPEKACWRCPCGVGECGYSDEDTAAGYADAHLHAEHSVTTTVRRVPARSAVGS